jgi:pyruvate formate lyase activating enzyme
LLDPQQAGQIAWDEVMSLLQRRLGLLDGVVFSGGEPTRQAALSQAVDQVRSFGYGIALHTAGAYPQRLEQLLDRLDWVGLDIKADAAIYPLVTGRKNSAERAFAALQLVLRSGVDHEVRITVDPTVHTASKLRQLLDDLAQRGVQTIVLQPMRSVINADQAASTCQLTEVDQAASTHQPTAAGQVALPAYLPMPQELAELLAQPPPGVQVRSATAGT